MSSTCSFHGVRPLLVLLLVPQMKPEKTAGELHHLGLVLVQEVQNWGATPQYLREVVRT